MKKTIFLLAFLLTAAIQAGAQDWANLTDEQKAQKAREFREDNQKYLKSLGLSEDQMTDIDNVNSCHAFAMERITHYSKDEASRKKNLEMANSARKLQMDLIMGPENRAKYEKYLTDKAIKVQGNVPAKK
jgi:hypothetical protein